MKRSIPLGVKTADALKQQLARFREKFGRDAGPDDPIFFDETSDVPLPMTKAQQQKLWNEVCDAMLKAGLPADKVYASRVTGLIPTQSNRHLMSDSDYQEWEDAVRRYRSLKKDKDKNNGR